MEMQTENKIQIPSRRQFFCLVPFAVLYASFLLLGDLESIADDGAFLILGMYLVRIAAAYLILLALCIVISEWRTIAARLPFFRNHPGHPVPGERPGRWYLYVLFFFICLLCYLPYYLVYFPTWLNNDAVWQIEQALGLVQPSNHHPYFHTMILKFLFLTGYRIFGTYTGGAAFYTFWQVWIMSMVFAFFLYQLYRRGTRIVWLVVATAFYAALPVNGILSICMGKDEFFTAALLFFSWMSAEIFSHNTIRGMAAYFITGFLVCVLRSNGIFIFLGTAAVLLFKLFLKRATFTKRFLIRVCVCLASVFACYLIYHGPVLKALHVEAPDTIEGLTMPTQHLLCAYLKGGELTEEEVAMIDLVVPVDEVDSYYNPYFFDIVKNFIRSDGNQEVIEGNKWDYFKLWLRVGLRNPLQYVVAEVRQTQGYWAYKLKNYQYLYADYFTTDNPFGMTTERKFFSYDAGLAVNEYLMKFQDLYNKVWSLGLNTWLMFFALAYSLYQKKDVLIFVPYLMLLFTLLLATPVYNEFRYAYGIFAALPLLLHYSFHAAGTDCGKKQEGEADEKTV